MKEKIENYLTNKEKLKTDLKEWVKDKSIPLDERFEVFIKSNLGDHRRFSESFNCKLGNVYLDYLEQRYETQKVDEIIDFYNEYKEKFTETDLITFKENVLEKFVKSFEFDW